MAEKKQNISMRECRDIFDLTRKDLAELFGATEEDISAYCGEQIASLDFRYYKPECEERDRLILSALKRIDSEEVDTTGRERQSDWERGWGENLQEFIDSGYDVGKLVPKYFKKSVPVRLNRDYVIPVCEDFVVNVTKVFRSWLFQKYFQKVDSIYEFGCGSAHHLAYLAALFPDKKLYGCDWAEASREIIRLLAQYYGWSIQSSCFDFFHPDETLNIRPNSAVLTFGALEQVGKNHELFLEFLLRKSPELCVNVEGLSELYEQEYLLDYLALKYHKRRKYLDGFLTRLHQLKEQGTIEIIKIHHQRFGNLFDDSHSYIVWKPKK